MTFAVANAVFALSVVLIARLVQDVGAGGAGTLMVRVDVGYVDDDSTSGRRARSRRCRQPPRSRGSRTTTAVPAGRRFI